MRRESDSLTAKPVPTASPAWKVKVIKANRAAVIFRRPIPTVSSASAQSLASFPIFRPHLHLSLLVFPHLHFANNKHEPTSPNFRHFIEQSKPFFFITAAEIFAHAIQMSREYID